MTGLFRLSPKNKEAAVAIILTGSAFFLQLPDSFTVDAEGIVRSASREWAGDQLFLVSEISKRCGVQEQTLHKAIRRGELHPVVAPGPRRLLHADVVAWMAGRESRLAKFTFNGQKHSRATKIRIGRAMQAKRNG